jgi:hypothetical protein
MVCRNGKLLADQLAPAMLGHGLAPIAISRARGSS